MGPKVSVSMRVLVMVFPGQKFAPVV